MYIHQLKNNILQAGFQDRKSLPFRNQEFFPDGQILFQSRFFPFIFPHRDRMVFKHLQVFLDHAGGILHSPAQKIDFLHLEKYPGVSTPRMLVKHGELLRSRLFTRSRSLFNTFQMSCDDAVFLSTLTDALLHFRQPIVVLVKDLARGDQVERIGYDAVLTQSGADPEQTACAFLEDAPQEPFFLSVGFTLAHRAYPDKPGPEDDPRYARAPAPLPDTPATRRDMACFYSAVHMLDAKMGAVFDALERTGLAENTLVICTTDHGIAFPRMKCNLTEPGIGVMLIMRGPGGFSGGKVIDPLVSQIDLYPTLCDLLGIDAPEHLQGVSLMPLVRGEASSVRDEVFAEVTFHAAYEPMRCVRTERYAYIRRFDGRVQTSSGTM